MKLNAKKTIFIILTMLSIAFFDTIRGVLMNSFIKFFDSNYKVMGTLVLASSLAYMIGSLFGGHIATIIGKEKLMRIATILMAIGILISAFSVQLWQLFLGFIIVGFANSVAVLIINITIPILDVKNHAWLMNFVHFIYGIGASAAVKTSGYLVEIGWTFRGLYLLVGVFYLSILILSFFISLPESETVEIKKNRFDMAGKRMLISFSLALGFYAVAELQTGIWLISYLGEKFALDENSASSYLSLFFLIFSLGRLFGGIIAHKFGYLKTVSVFLLLSLVLYTSGLLMGIDGINLIVISGVFFSICYPTVLLALKNYFPNTLSMANGIVVFSASGVNMAVSFLMGYLSDEFGVATAIWVIPFALSLSFIMLLFIQIQHKKHQY